MLPLAIKDEEGHFNTRYFGPSSFGEALSERYNPFSFLETIKVTVTKSLVSAMIGYLLFFNPYLQQPSLLTLELREVANMLRVPDPKRYIGTIDPTAPSGDRALFYARVNPCTPTIRISQAMANILLHKKNDTDAICDKSAKLDRRSVQGIIAHEIGHVEQDCASLHFGYGDPRWRSTVQREWDADRFALRNPQTARGLFNALETAKEMILSSKIRPSLFPPVETRIAFARNSICKLFPDENRDICPQKCPLPRDPSENECITNEE